MFDGQRTVLSCYVKVKRMRLGWLIDLGGFHV